jgi:hypothetical protein
MLPGGRPNFLSAREGLLGIDSLWKTRFNFLLTRLNNQGNFRKSKEYIKKEDHFPNENT